MKMDPEHKKKIDEAIQVCEKAYKDLFEHSAKHLTKEVQSKFQYFILQNTAVYGGVFRSIFTGQKVKDIDVYFHSYDAVAEFRQMVHTGDFHQLFPKEHISKRNTYLFILGKPPMQFMTKEAGDASTLFQSFDFSWNQHYFNLYAFDMRFNIDTFAKRGHHVCSTDDPLKTYMRMLRFKEEGFKMRRADTIQIAKDLVNRDLPSADKIYDMPNWIFESDENPKKRYAEQLELTGMTYYTNDYLGIESIKAKSKLKKSLTQTLSSVSTSGVWSTGNLAQMVADTTSLVPPAVPMYQLDDPDEEEEEEYEPDRPPLDDNF